MKDASKDEDAVMEEKTTPKEARKRSASDASIGGKGKKAKQSAKPETKASKRKASDVDKEQEPSKAEKPKGTKRQYRALRLLSDSRRL